MRTRFTDPHYARADRLDKVSPGFTLAQVSVDLSKFSAVLLDLDGTVYSEEHPLPGALELIRNLQSSGRTLGCLSNSALSPQGVIERMKSMGVDLSKAEVFTAARAACDYVLKHYPAKAKVFNLATQSVQDMLDGRVQWVHRRDEPCDAIISAAPSDDYAGEDRQRMALELLRHGSTLVGLCADRVYPSPRGIEFGSGSLCAMLAYAANITPIFCGKPQPIFFHELCERIKVDPTKCVLIGDNPESDIGGARSVGMTSVLVLSGVARRKDVDKLPTKLKPDYVIESLTELLTV
ncbi:MAG TPA: HAD-IIA family hydrolase [Tepidisphaeraceae bacterium]|nr:HAD-IIA family hydrolase [Tepidisphaeraceae bacterium]